jgi:isopenicillin N synthase-like dioxygenase
MNAIPCIDVAGLVDETSVQQVADQIGTACRESGFFYIVGHGVRASLVQQLEAQCQEFFAWKTERKLDIRMEKGGLAWRGYFPVGSELTSGQPDQKEGIYFGSELDGSHPKVEANEPMHGPNLFPEIPGMRETVLEYIDALTQLGHRLMQAIALSLELPKTYFQQHLTFDPLILFRVFHYPPLLEAAKSEQWSVGEHTDYGLLTILRQDESGGLQVKSQGKWIDAPPIADSFVCNIGDMLDRMTAGTYRSTAHRVRNPGTKGRLSFPFFFDPSFDAKIHPIKTAATADNNLKQDGSGRWDRESVHDFDGTYRDYVLRKVAKVFPDLAKQVDAQDC